VTATHAKPYSTDRNLMHVSYEGGILEDPWAEPPADIFQMTKAPEDAKAEGEYLVVGFERGVPVSVNGEALGAVELVETLNRVGGAHASGASTSSRTASSG
jgi:Argininosuccinate synthase